MATDPRWIITLRVLAVIAIVSLGAVITVRLLTSDASTTGKIVGTVGVAAIMGGGAIRIWLASRPYGLGAWDQRKQSG
ncbi:MAG: hypothetical protein QNJ88_08010 [Acidimicrobiia bacterium]|nr:hypothetical protein [Acidimicrobiia bacterium]